MSEKRQARPGAQTNRNLLQCFVMALLLVLVPPSMANAYARPDTSAKELYKQVSGWYGNNDGVCLFEDGTFLLYGYATAVFGHYVSRNGKLLFYPDKPDLFEVYATYNPGIGDSTRINFRGFERGGKAVVQWGHAPAQQVFNDDANCFDAPFVYSLSHKLRDFTLSCTIAEEEPGYPVPENTWQYKHSGYNDFIWYFHKPRREEQDFVAVLRQNGDKQNLFLSEYGDGKGYPKRSLADESRRQEWNELLEMKTQYYRDKENVKLGLLANKHYKLFLQDGDDYRFDSVTNQYIRKDAAEQDEYDGRNAYDDDRRLRRYVKLSPETKKKQVRPVQTTGSLFFSACNDDSGRSYHYPGLDREAESADPPAVMTVAAPPLPATASDTVTDGEREYKQGDLVIKEVYRNRQLVWEERWNMGKSTATIRHFKAGKVIFRVEITDRYSLMDEVITVYDSKGKIMQRKVASEQDGAIWFRVYDAKGRFQKKEASYEVQDWLKDPGISSE